MKGFLASLFSLLRRRSPEQTWDAQLSAAADLPAVDKLAHVILTDALKRRASEIQVGLWTKSELGASPAESQGQPPGEAEALPEALDLEAEVEYQGQPGKEFAVRYRIEDRLKTIMYLPQCEWPEIRGWFQQKAHILSVGSPRGDPGNGRETGKGRINLRLTREDGAQADARFEVTMAPGGENETIRITPVYDEQLLKWLTAAPGTE